VPFVAPPALRPGDSVAIVAPSGPFDRPSFEAGLALVKARYTPHFTDGLFAQQRYFAGDDARRGDELNRAFSDPGIKAVFTARGGYGSMRLLTGLSLGAPKIFVGFSDVTAVHGALQAHGVRSLHGPVLTQLGNQPPGSVERFFNLLESPLPSGPLLNGRTVVAGVAEGPLVGGNLSVLTRLLGTRFMPPTRGAVLLLEDVGERPYRLDRMWTHLALAGAFDGLAGIVLGDFTGCEERDADYGSADVLQSLARQTGLPCAAGFAIGHGAVNLPVPLGARVRLDASSGRLDFLEALVA
jgi:muramoyltetrapeptide carboxypeptidase